MANNSAETVKEQIISFCIFPFNFWKILLYLRIENFFILKIF
jgi:hypothetical protein